MAETGYQVGISRYELKALFQGLQDDMADHAGDQHEEDVQGCCGSVWCAPCY